MDDNGWRLDENNLLHPVWYLGEMLPQTIINELPETETDDDDAEEEEETDTSIDNEDYSDFIAGIFNESEDEEEFEGFADDE